MRGSILPLPNTPSWLGAQLKKSTGTTLPSPYVGLRHFICTFENFTFLNLFVVTILAPQNWAHLLSRNKIISFVLNRRSPQAGQPACHVRIKPGTF
jgi:hypothetical protein